MLSDLAEGSSSLWRTRTEGIRAREMKVERADVHALASPHKVRPCKTATTRTRAQVVLILFLTYFLLAAGDLCRRKIVHIAGPSLTKKKSHCRFSKRSTGRCQVPAGAGDYIGPPIVTGALAVVAYLQFGTLEIVVTAAGIAFVITSLKGMFLTPWLTSRAARMNAAAVFIGLIFWSWIWEVWGFLLAVPMLMTIKAVCDRVEDLKPIGELLGE